MHNATHRGQRLIVKTAGFKFKIHSDEIIQKSIENWYEPIVLYYVIIHCIVYHVYNVAHNITFSSELIEEQAVSIAPKLHI